MLPAWPWRETMLTAANAYLLWAFTWLQFVVTMATFSYHGQNLWFYTENAPPFQRTIPELFLAFSIALALFSLTAITGSTWRTPRLWKRLLTVGIFAACAIGFSCLNLHLRHESYASAIRAHQFHQARWIEFSRASIHSTDEYLLENTAWERGLMEQYEANISRYEKKFGIAEPP